jgi:4-amino-4-deoxy-L-arabinose transferase-like glycosyltransferase
MAVLDGTLGVVVAAAAGVVVRLAYVLVMAGTKLSDDETSFWAIAHNIATGHGFSYQGRSTAWRPPLYTGVLAAARWLGMSIRDVQLAQAVVGAATVVLLFAVTRELTGSHRAGVVAAWIGALYPPFVYFSGRMLSENAAIPLYVAALWLSVAWLQRGGTGRAAWCGLAWGAAILGRPTMVPVAVLCVVVGLWAWGGASRRGGSRLGQAAVVAVVMIVVLAPWVARNASAVGGPEPVTSNEGFALWSANRLDDGALKSVNDDVRYPGMQDYAVYGRAFPGIEALARTKGFDFDQASEAAQDAWFRKLATHDIEARPARFVVRTIERAGLVLVPAPDNASQTAKTGKAAKLVLWVTSGPVIVVGILGLAWLVIRRRREPVAWFLLLSAVGSLLLVATHVPDVRYRVDGVDPILIVTAAWLVADLVLRPREETGPGPETDGDPDTGTRPDAAASARQATAAGARP